MTARPIIIGWHGLRGTWPHVFRAGDLTVVHCWLFSVVWRRR